MGVGAGLYMYVVVVKCSRSLSYLLMNSYLICCFIICICHCPTYMSYLPLPSSRRRLSYDDRLEDKSENYQNCSVLYCV